MEINTYSIGIEILNFVFTVKLHLFVKYLEIVIIIYFIYYVFIIYL